MFKLQRKLYLIIAIFGLLLGLASCDSSDVVRVKLDAKEYVMLVGQQIDVQPIVVKGANVSRTNIVFSSTNEDVVTYTNGVLKAVGEGEAIIKAQSEDHPLAYATAKVTVKFAESLNATFTYENEMFKGAEQTIVCALDADSISCSYSFASANEEIATVDENGKVMGLKAGEAVLYATVRSASDETRVRDYILRITVLESDYEVTYDLDNGENHSENPTTYNSLHLPVELKEPTRSGYNFLGWYLNDELVTEIEEGTTGNVHLVARWEKAIFGITYNLDGGNNHEANPDEFSAIDLPLTLQAPTKEGYKFLGWFIGTDKVETLTADDLHEIELTAHWELETYSIQYDLDGGSVVPATIFEGEGTNAFTLTTYISYDVNGKAAGILKTATPTWWSYIALRKTTIDDLYEIVQFASKNSGVTEEFDLLITWHGSFEDKTSKTALEAIKANASNVGNYIKLTNIPEEATKAATINGVLYTKEQVSVVNELTDSYTINDSVSFLNVAKPGYTFVGWFDGENKVDNISTGTVGNKTLVAKFDLINYTITYDLSEGSFVPSIALNGEGTNAFTLTTYLSYDVNGKAAGILQVATPTWWSYIALRETSMEGLYEIVQFASKNSGVTEEFDLLITWHSAFEDKTSKAALEAIKANASNVGNYIMLTNIPEESTKAASISGVMYSKEQVESLTTGKTTYTVVEEVVLLDAVKEGFTFVGWFDGENKVEKIELGTMKDVTLVAKFEAVTE